MPTPQESTSSPTPSSPKEAVAAATEAAPEVTSDKDTVKKGKSFVSAKIKPVYIICLILVLVWGAAVTVFFLMKEPGASVTIPDIINPSASDDSRVVERPTFAEYELALAEFSPNVPDYQLGSDMANVVNLSRFDFSDEMLKQLEESHFVAVSPELEGVSVFQDEFFEKYSYNKYDDLPSFITTDSILHTYHLLYDDTLKTLEQSAFFAQMTTASEYLFKESKSQYDYFSNEGNSEYADAAKRNVAYFGVGLRLLGKDPNIPAYAKDLVQADLAQIDSHESMTCSMVMDLDALEGDECYKEDFTQYVPRGHYTRTARLKKYFKALMWYGRMTFRQKDDSETLSALLMTYTIQNDEDVMKAWSDVYDATTFMVGSSDDLGVYDYNIVMMEQFDSPTELATLENEESLTSFKNEIADLRSPAINSMIVMPGENVEDETKGFRFTGQRYTLDADIFQRLIAPEVPERNIPKSLDILAGMGSEAAEALLEDEGDYDLENYEENLTEVQEKINSYDEETWTQNLYYGWLYMLHPLATPVEEGYPDFMNNQLWTYRDMNTYLGSWTELKHDTILYSKQPYGLGAGGFEYIDVDDRGYVEPRPDVYARLEGLAKMTREGLEDRGLLEKVDYSFTEGSGPACNLTGPDQECTATYTFSSEDLKENLDKLESIAKQLKLISVKELTNQTLTDEEYDFIRDFGEELRDIWWFTLHDEHSDPMSSVEKNPVMIVADVATDPAKGVVLEEGLGRVMDLFVIIPVSGGSTDYYRVARGVSWSHYEFEQPMNDRLTDEAWRQQVRDGDLPDFSEWKEEFIFNGETVKIAERPITYKIQIDAGKTEADAQEECENMDGTFESCGNVCLESEPDCDTPCEPICRFY